MNVAVPWGAYHVATLEIIRIAREREPGDGVRDVLTQAARDTFAKMIERYTLQGGDPASYREALKRLDEQLAHLDRETEQWRRDQSRKPS